MAPAVGAELAAVHAVGEQQFGGAARAAGRACHHRHGSVEFVEHGGEALVRRGELLADAPRLGDVGHRGHPAGLAPLPVDQRRDVHPGVEQRPVAAPDLDLVAARRGVAAQQARQALVILLGVAGRPVGIGRHGAGQFVLVEADHLAEGTIDVGDAALEVERAHAGQDRVFHRLAEGGLGGQRELGAAPLGDVARDRVQQRTRRIGVRVAAQRPVQPAPRRRGRVAGLGPGWRVLRVARRILRAETRLEAGRRDARLADLRERRLYLVAVVGMHPAIDAATSLVGAEHGLECGVAAHQRAVGLEHAQRVGRQREQAVALVLGEQAAARMAPEHQQAREDRQRQADHRRHQRAIDQARLDLVGERAQPDAVAGGIERQLVAQMGQVDLEQRRTDQRVAFLVDHGELVAIADRLQQRAAEQAIERVADDDRTGEAALVVDRCVQLDQHVAGGRGERGGEHRALALADLFQRGASGRVGDGCAARPLRGQQHAARVRRMDDTRVGVDDRHVDHRIAAREEFVDRPVGRDRAAPGALRPLFGDQADLVLVVAQLAAQRGLCAGEVAIERLSLLVRLHRAQVPEERPHQQHEQPDPECVRQREPADGPHLGAARGRVVAGFHGAVRQCTEC